LHDLTHASFFSGVGGLDLGLERAGWRTVSFSEIDPYASAVLAERWPGVPNLGDITQLAGSEPAGSVRDTGPDQSNAGARIEPSHGPLPAESSAATLWTGGFPCQDLSVAGKRAGFAGDRSSLAFAFLDLVERHRPPAILLENVPGLLSSNGGKDFGALLGRLGQLGYWWAYRILDAQFSGVPQRRRRVFIVALHAESGFGADSAAEVLSVGSRCDGHSATGDETGPDVAYSLAASSRGTGDQHGNAWNSTYVPNIYNATAKFGEFVEDDIAGNLSARDYKSSNHLVSPSPDPGGVREADGLAGRMDDSPLAFRKSARVNSDTSPETWVDDGLANTLNSFDVGDIRSTHAVVGPAPEVHVPNLPLGLDSHRYRCCGNGVVSNVSEWIGRRLAEAMA
jgi:DNA (cytosine-5)-methyltransferase 1